MKRTVSLIIFAAVAVMLSSCGSSSLPERMDSFVDKAELNADGYTPEDWEKSTQDFQALIQKYSESGNEYSEAEKQMAARAMGRYHALLLKNGLEKTKSIFENLGKIIPDYIDGFAAEIENNSEGFLNELESIIDTSKVNESFDKLGKALESLFGTTEGSEE